MKKLVFCIVVTFFVALLSSCGRKSSSPSRGEQQKAGIEKVVVVDKQYSIICFNTKTSSNSLFMFMAKSGYSLVKTTELKSILADLATKEKRHASVYGANEYSLEASMVLKQLVPAMALLLPPVEVLSPIFHEKGGKLFPDYGDFASGWAGKGYVVVTKKTTTKRR